MIEAEFNYVTMSQSKLVLAYNIKETSFTLLGKTESYHNACKNISFLNIFFKNITLQKI